MFNQRNVLKRKVKRQQQVLKEASETIFNNVGQSLSLAKIKLATTDLDKPEAAREKIEDSHEIVQEVIKDLRQLGNHIDSVMNDNDETHKENYEKGKGDQENS